MNSRQNALLSLKFSDSALPEHCCNEVECAQQHHQNQPNQVRSNAELASFSALNAPGYLPLITAAVIKFEWNFAPFLYIEKQQISATSRKECDHKTICSDLLFLPVFRSAANAKTLTFENEKAHSKAVPALSKVLCKNSFAKRRVIVSYTLKKC